MGKTEASAKLRANKRYLAKFKTISVRIPLEDMDSVHAAAEAAGQSVNQWILDAIRDKL